MENIQKLRTPHLPVYGCWYEKDPELQQYEISCLKRFRTEYSPDKVRFTFNYDSQRRMAVNGTMRFKPETGKPWQTWRFVMIFEHDHPGRDSTGMFGGSIRIYVLGTVKPDGSLKPIKGSFHHALWDSALGQYYVCQTRESTSDKVNSYYAMKRFLRWLLVYNVWLETGVDIDRDK